MTHDLHPILSERWSPRGFDATHRLADADVSRLLEAARWAPSASNTQPWRFLVGIRGTVEHEVVLQSLAGFNAAWAGSAAALVVIAAVTADDEGKPLPWAAYDAGQAAAHLTVQAHHDGLHVHQMGGFDADALARAIDIDEVVRPLVVVAIGRHDPHAALPEPLASRETAPRERKRLEDLHLSLTAAARSAVA